MTKAEIKKSYENYKSLMRKAKHVVGVDDEGNEIMRRPLRAGAEDVLTFKEYEAQYYVVDMYIQAMKEEGTRLSHSQFIASGQYETSDDFIITACNIWYQETGEKKSLKEATENIEEFARQVRALFDDDESYDAVISSSIGWNLWY